MKYSKGIMWLDDCRIPFVDEGEHILKYSGYSQGTYNTNGNGLFYGNKATSNQQGRFTPNLLVCDDMLNDGSMTKSGFNPNANIKQYRGGNFGGGKTNDNGIDYGDKGSNSRYYDLDKWFDKIIDEI
jgi:hypothetical protein